MGDRQDRINSSEPQYRTANTRPPRWLSEQAQEIWAEFAELVSEAGLLTQADKPILAMWCESYATAIEAAQDLARQGPTVESSRGATVKNPSATVLHEAFLRMEKCSRRFGFTPSDRQSLVASASREVDPLESLLADMN